MAGCGSCVLARTWVLQGSCVSCTVIWSWESLRILPHLSGLECHSKHKCISVRPMVPSYVRENTGPQNVQSPGYKFLVSLTQCPDRIPFGYQPIYYQPIPSMFDTIRYRHIKYLDPPVKPDEAQPASDTVPVQKSKVKKIMSRAREVTFNSRQLGGAHRKPQAIQRQEVTQPDTARA
ncbi:hypothetical protein M405DRAFT_884298 [Rhizopogon salebrosus TDB-379]|nr:hypothetical protein M405DRAFT_884298 [Rhizopogon salebrosus TDB-379]